MHLACHCCGLIHRVPPLAEGDRAFCTRCDATLYDPRRATRSASRTAAAAMAALILFWPAVLLPILEVDRLGHSHSSSIVSGTIELLREGEYFVGVVILLFSIVFPLTKIVLLLELSLMGLMHQRHKGLTYRVMEHAGRWSMMDVMLLALLVMLVKIGDLVSFHFGPAVITFVLCVAMSMVASMVFDPHAIWEEQQ